MRRTFISVALFALLSAPSFAQENASAPTSCPPLKQVARIGMARDAAGLSWVPVTINGTRKLFVLTTGIFVSQLFMEAVDDMNLPRERFSGTVDMYGNTSTMMANTKGIGVGNLPVARSYVSNRYRISPSDNPAYEASGKMQAGKLGLDILIDESRDIDIDFGSNTLNLFSSDHCAGKVVYWDAPGLSVIPYDLNFLGQLRVPVTVDGVRLQAVLNTGMSTTALNQDVAVDLMKIDLNGPGVEKMEADRATIHKKRIGTIALDGIVISNQTVEIIPDRVKAAFQAAAFSASVPFGSGTSLSVTTGGSAANREQRLPDIILGADVLNKLHIYIATKERKLYISPATPPAAPPPAPAPAP